MQQATQAAQSPAQVLELKAGSFSLLSLRLNSTDIAAIEAGLAAKIAQAPQFFEQASVVIDLDALAELPPVSLIQSAGEPAPDFFPALTETLRRHGLSTLAVHGGSPHLQNRAREAGLSVLGGGFRGEKEAAPKTRDIKIINRAIRSGQQIHAAGADLVVLGPVSAGAEVLADGHIHVYGPLRGRALAGLDGDTRARIICQRLEAELVSVAGNYRVLEDIDPSLVGAPAQIYLDGDRLCMEAAGSPQT